MFAHARASPLDTSNHKVVLWLVRLYRFSCSWSYLLLVVEFGPKDLFGFKHADKPYYPFRRLFGLAAITVFNRFGESEVEVATCRLGCHFMLLSVDRATIQAIPIAPAVLEKHLASKPSPHRGHVHSSRSVLRICWASSISTSLVAQ